MRVNKSNLMKTAWEIARNAAAKFNKSVKSFFSESLKLAWKKLKDEILIMGLCEIGNEWAKGRHHRVYFNDLTEYVNVDTLSWKHEKELRRNTAHYRIDEKCWYSGVETPELWRKLKKSIEKKARDLNMTIHRKYKMKPGKFIKKEARIITERFDGKIADGVKPESGLKVNEPPYYYNAIMYQVDEYWIDTTQDERIKLLEYINSTFNLNIEINDGNVEIGEREIILREYHATPFAGTQALYDLETLNPYHFRIKISEILAAIPKGLSHFRNIAEESPFLF